MVSFKQLLARVKMNRRGSKLRTKRGRLFTASHARPRPGSRKSAHMLVFATKSELRGAGVSVDGGCGERRRRKKRGKRAKGKKTKN